MSGRLIEIPYKPRDAFKAYHASDKRFGVSVCHRRAGKTVARINRLIRAAAVIRRDDPPGSFAYLAPYHKQAKRIAWLYLKRYAAPLVALGGKINESDLMVTMPHNGATITLLGAENAESIRGVYFDGIVVDEAQAIAGDVVSQIVMPCLSDYQGWLDVSGTPRGWVNTLGIIKRLALGQDEKGKPFDPSDLIKFRAGPHYWFHQQLKASESGILSDDELAYQRAMMSDDQYQQEFECSFDAAITGAVYGKEIAHLDEIGRIKTGIFMPNAEVHTAWDLGYDDSTAIWFWQIHQFGIVFIDFFEDSTRDTAYYCGILTERAKSCGYRYGRHYVPHDAANEMMAAGGRSIVAQAWERGVKMQVVPATSQQNSIETLRVTLRSSWFDQARCAEGLEALRQYQFEFDEDKKVYRSRPRHDWSSHAADAAEIAARAWREPIVEARKEAPRFLDQARAEELFDLKGEFSRVTNHAARRI